MTGAVKLVIKLKIIQIDDNECQRTFFVFLKFFIQYFRKILPVQKTGKFIRSRLMISLLIKPGVFDGNGSNRCDGIQKLQIVIVQLLLSFFLSEKKYTNQLIAIF